MSNKRTHAFGVPLRRPGKRRDKVRIGTVTHAYYYGYAKATTLCGMRYTHKTHQTRNGTILATRTTKDVDCMSCLVQAGRVF